MGSTIASRHPQHSTGAGRVLLAAVIVLLVAAVAAIAASGPVAAQESSNTGDETTTSAVVESDGPSPAGNILPRPGSGQAPESSGDPGGWLQYVVFALILAGLALIVLLVIRESKKAKAG